MKKTILVGLFTAMMLFAFIACDNSAPEIPIYGNASVVGASLNSAPVYIVGDKFDKADITVDVLLNVGEPITYTGSEVNATLSGSSLVNGPNQVKVTVPGGTADAYNVVVYAYAPESYTINLAPAQSSITVTEESDLEDYTELLEDVSVTISYDGGKTITRGYTEEIPSELTTFITEAFSTYGEDYTTIDEAKKSASMDIGAILKAAAEAEDDIDVTISGNYVLNATYSEKTVKSVSITPSDKNEFFAVGTNNVLNRTTFDFTATLTYSDNTTETLTRDELTEEGGYDYKLLNIGTSGVTFKEASEGVTALTSFDLDIAIVDEDGDLVDSIKTITVKAVEDYPVVFNAVTEVEDEEGETKAYKVGNHFDPKDFEFSVKTWASGKTATAEDTVEYKEFETEDFIKEGYTEDGTVDVTFTYIGYKGVKDVADAVCTGVEFTLK